MRLYLAGIYTANFHKGSNLYNRLTDYEKYQRDNVSYLLESFHYINKESKVNPIRNDGRKIFLDSGAFSAYTQGARINLKNYVDFIKRNIDIIEVIDGILVASVLDGIGDPLLTYQNQLAMEKLGVRPLPCFHYGEDERYLEWYVSHYQYITIGGMVPISTPQLFYWLDRIWERYLCDGAGRPKVRVHGFGLSQIDLMKRYPWYSVDSSSWVQVARVGGMLLLDGRIVSVSNVSPNRKIEWRHIDTLPPIQREAIEKRLTECGVDLQRMRETYLSRWAYNIWAYDQLGKIIHTENPKFIFDQMGLFG
jgi:hypothetical protein